MDDSTHPVLERAGYSHRSTEAELVGLLALYRQTHAAINVSFRRLTPDLAGPDHVTHTMHPYPAKLLVQIPHFFLHNLVLAPSKGVVLDPFCGSGTVVLEAALSGRPVFAADANPLARLITRVKVTPISARRLQRAIESLAKSIGTSSPDEAPSVINLRYWFRQPAIAALGKIAAAIRACPDADCRRFFEVCLSACVRRVSLANPRFSVPVRIKTANYPRGHWLRTRLTEHMREMTRLDEDTVIRLFQDVVDANSQRLGLLRQAIGSTAAVEYVASDARELIYPQQDGSGGVAPLPSQSIDLAITSPPYIGAQKYIRASSLSLGWLGLCPPSGLRALEDQTIGREHYRKAQYQAAASTGIDDLDAIIERVGGLNPLRAHMTASYFNEMRIAFAEIARVVKPEGHLVLISGSNTVCGQYTNTPNFLKRHLEAMGFECQLELHDDIRGRALQTSRNGSSALISKEVVAVFRKERSAPCG